MASPVGCAPRLGRSVRRVNAMNRRADQAVRWIGLLLLASASLCLGGGAVHAQSQYPLMDRIAAKVVQKYQSTSCQQLKNERVNPPTGEREAIEKRVIALLHQDPKMREAFLDRVAAPIANKLFECGMIP